MASSTVALPMFVKWYVLCLLNGKCYAVLKVFGSLCLTLLSFLFHQSKMPLITSKIFHLDFLYMSPGSYVSVERPFEMEIGGTVFGHVWDNVFGPFFNLFFLCRTELVQIWDIWYYV
ncbi:hypothetical protein AMTRI_Chr07g30600 [Amborella trichopoda]